jgi:hypothetical protein
MPTLHFWLKQGVGYVVFPDGMMSVSRTNAGDAMNLLKVRGYTKTKVAEYNPRSGKLRAVFTKEVNNA